MRLPYVLSLSFILSLSVISGAIAQDRPDYLTPGEILKLVESSTAHYNLKTGKIGEEELADPLAALFPEREAHTFYPVVTTTKEGKRSIGQFQFDSAAFALLARSEPYFISKETDKARELCRQALAISPNCYLAYAYLGDTYLFGGEPEAGLHYYDSAIAINSDDYQPQFYKANALLKAGHLDQARNQYIDLLVLNPRHENTYAYLREYADELEITLNEHLFLPKAVARQNGESIDIVFHMSDGAFAWMVYGMAKGMWLGEPEHRKQYTGSSERFGWSSVEETECIGALLQAYSSGLEDGKIKREEQLDLLLKIAKDGYLLEFLLYEFGSRVFPDVMLLQGDELHSSMREFIAKYVVVRN